MGQTGTPIVLSCFSPVATQQPHREAVIVIKRRFKQQIYSDYFRINIREVDPKRMVASVETKLVLCALGILKSDVISYTPYGGKDPISLTFVPDARVALVTTTPSGYST